MGWTSCQCLVTLIDVCGKRIQTQKVFDYKNLDTQLQIYLLCQHSFRVRVKICMVAVLLFVILLLTQLLHCLLTQSLVSERPVRAQSLQTQLMFATSTDVVVYYLIRKSSLIAFKWYDFYTIEVTISLDISKIKFKKHYCLLMGAYFRV